MRSGGLFLKREIYVPNQWAGWRGRTSCPVVVKKSRAKGDVTVSKHLHSNIRLCSRKVMKMALNYYEGSL